MYSLIPLLIIGVIAWICIRWIKRKQKTVVNTEPRMLIDQDDQPQQDIRCPHCSHAFEKMPVRKRKCPACREWIWPKRPPGKKNKQLVTIEQAEAWEIEWETVMEQREIENATEGYARSAGAFGGEEAEREFRKNFPDAHEKSKERHGDSKRAVDIAAREAMGHPEKSSYQQKLIALDDAWKASRADGDYMPYIIKHHREALREIKIDSNMGVHHVRLVACGPGGRFCPACKAMDGRVFRILGERKKPHLPVVGCTCTGSEDHQKGFCLCYYVPAFDDEV